MWLDLSQGLPARLQPWRWLGLGLALCPTLPIEHVQLFSGRDKSSHQIFFWLGFYLKYSEPNRQLSSLLHTDNTGCQGWSLLPSPWFERALCPAALSESEAWDTISITNDYNLPLSAAKNRSLGNSSPSPDLAEISIFLLRKYKSQRLFIPLCGFRDLHAEQNCSLETLEKQQTFNIARILSVRNSFSVSRTHTGIRTFPNKHTFLWTSEFVTIV